jgi:hypothetical protein
MSSSPFPTRYVRVRYSRPIILLYSCYECAVAQHADSSPFYRVMSTVFEYLLILIPLTHHFSSHFFFPFLFSPLFISSHLISSYIISCHLISSLLIFSFVISSHLISSHLISSHLISSHLICSYLISLLLFFKGPSATIKTHHNVGGLPASMHLKLLEPLRELFKDEVRELGVALGIADESVWRHPFPGPGLAIR